MKCESFSIGMTLLSIALLQPLFHLYDLRNNELNEELLAQYLATFDAVYDFGIKDPNFVLGPKFLKTNEYYTILATEVQSCLSGKIGAEEACNNIKTQLDDINGA